MTQPRGAGFVTCTGAGRFDYFFNAVSGTVSDGRCKRFSHISQARSIRWHHSLYPDLDSPPDELKTAEERADYVQRVCGQWDYGLVPEPETFRLLSRWKDVFDAFPLPHSAAYHAFRSGFGWEPVPGHSLRATYEIYDLQEGRTDPCRDAV